MAMDKGYSLLKFIQNVTPVFILTSLYTSNLKADMP